LLGEPSDEHSYNYRSRQTSPLGMITQAASGLGTNKVHICVWPICGQKSILDRVSLGESCGIAQSSYRYCCLPQLGYVR